MTNEYGSFYQLNAESSEIVYLTENNIGVSPAASKSTWVFNDTNSDSIVDLEIWQNNEAQVLVYGSTSGDLIVDILQQNDSNDNIGNSAVVGTLDGALSVSPTGGAVYTLPIQVPPGLNGLQPTLNLVYNSQSGDGLLGTGWRLTGLSSITRCGTDQTRDGFVDPVDYDSNDAFCLDGSRLIEIAANEYVTEISDGQTIKKEGDHFVLYAKNGSKLYFGTTDESRISGHGSNVFGHLLDLQIDVFGNQIQYSYTNEKHISSITYLDRSVHFEYKSRGSLEYKETFLAKSTPYTLSKVLEKIEVKANNQSLFSYHLKYKHYSMNHYLEEVKQCDANQLCLQPSLFTYDNLYSSSYSSTWSDNRMGDYFDGNKYVADVDGDGLDDVVRVFDNNGKLGAEIFKSTGSRLEFLWRKTHLGDVYAGQTLLLDVNGDGRTDLVHAYEKNGKLAIAAYRSTGTSFVYEYGWSDSSLGDNYTGEVYPADVNADGRTDLIQVFEKNAKLNVKMYQSNGSGFAYQYGGSEQLDSPYNVEKRLGDINADGRTDLFLLTNNNGKLSVKVYASNGARFDYLWGDSYFADSSDGEIQIVDVNGDFFSDLIQMRARSNGKLTINTFLSDGSKLGKAYGVTYFSNHLLTTFDGEQYLSDVNGDGLTDVTLIRPTYSGNIEIQSYLWRGNGYREDYASAGEGAVEYYGASSFTDTLSTQMLGQRYPIDVDGDGITDFLQIHDNNSKLAGRLLASNWKRPVIRVFDDGLEKLEVGYDYLGTYDQYEADTVSSTTGDIQNSIFNLPVVSHLQQVRQGQIDKTTYAYKGLKAHKQGLGLLGFQEMSVTHELTGEKRITAYSHDWENRTVGMPIKEVTLSSTGVLLSETIMDYETYEQNGIYFPYLARSTTTTRDLDQSLKSTLTSENRYTNQYDAPYGYALEESKSCVTGTVSVTNATIPCATLSGKIKETTNHHVYHMADQFAADIGPLLSRTSTTSRLFNVTLPFEQSLTQTRTQSFDYHSGTGALKTKIIEPDSPSESLVMAYTYTGQGQLKTTTESGGINETAIGTSTTTYTYEPGGLYRLKEKENALGHRESYEYNDTLFTWLATDITDIDGRTTSILFDSFGGIYEENYPDNTSKQTDRFWCTDGCGIGASYYIQVTQTNAPATVTYFDVYGQSIRTETEGQHDDQTIATIVQTTEFDVLGRPKKVSLPYFDFDSQNAIYTNIIYDSLDRPKTVTTPEGNTVTYSYSGNSVTSTFMPFDGVGGVKTKTENYNALNQLVSVKDTANNTISYLFDAFDNLVQTTDPENNNIQSLFDIKGRQLKLNDPDHGLTTFTYYADDLIRTKTNAKSQVITHEYDLIGRLIKQTDPEHINEWIYDGCQNGVGKLCSKTNNAGFSESYTYNTLGLLNKSARSIAGISNLVHEYSYDFYDRPFITQYPGGFVTRNEYSGLGHIARVTDETNSNTLWKPTEFNAKGQIKKLKQGNLEQNRWFESTSGLLDEQRVYQSGAQISHLDYTWHDNGNLDTKTHAWKNRAVITETYEYDSLDRLDGYTIDVGTTRFSTVYLNYDSLGNIIHKSDVGTYQYTSGRPHAVSNIDTKGDYTYDSNGNLLSGGGRTISYTVHNKPRVITKGAETSTFTYGPDQNRYKRVDTGTVASTIYYSGAYERETKNGVTTERVNLGDFAILEKTSGVQETLYTLRDHLGSLIATVKDNGEAKRAHFDPWGKRINPEVADPEFLKTDVLSLMSHVTQRGFTGHEHISNVGLIHMNGRVFDPEIARFLSPDPYIQAPTHLASFNRYSYVWNNPVRYTDPSGYFVDWFVKNVFEPLGKEIGRGLETLGGWIEGAFRGFYRLYDSVRNGLSSVNRKVRQNFRHAEDWAKDKWPQIRRVAVTTLAYVTCGGTCAAAVYSGRRARDHGARGSAVWKAAAIGGITAALFHGAGTIYGNVTNASTHWATKFAIKAGLHGTIGCASAKASGGSCRDGAIAAGLAGGYNAATNGGLALGVFGETASGILLSTVEAGIIGGATNELLGGSFGDGFELAANGQLNNWIPHAIAGAVQLGRMGIQAGIRFFTKRGAAQTRVAFEKGATRNSVRQVETELSTKKAIQNLKKNGFEAKTFKAQNGGTGHVLTNGQGTIYRFYPNATSTGGNSAEVIKNGVRTSKIRFDQKL